MDTVSIIRKFKCSKESCNWDEIFVPNKCAFICLLAFLTISTLYLETVSSYFVELFTIQTYGSLSYRIVLLYSLQNGKSRFDRLSVMDIFLDSSGWGAIRCPTEKRKVKGSWSYFLTKTNSFDLRVGVCVSELFLLPPSRPDVSFHVTVFRVKHIPWKRMKSMEIERIGPDYLLGFFCNHAWWFINFFTDKPCDCAYKTCEI